MQALLSIFDTSDFPERWHCGNWTDFLGWLHIVSDLVIFSSYMAIPLVITYFLRRRPDLPFPQVAWLFAAFIAFCGFGHLVEAIIFWNPVYRFAGLVKLLTALASIGTVFALFRYTPAMLAMPERAAMATELERSNRDLEQFASVAAHDLQEPLRKIEGYLGMIERELGASLPEKSAQHFQKVVDATGRMRKMVLGVLDFAQAGKKDNEWELINLKQAIMAARVDLEDEITAAQGTIEFRGEFPYLRLPANNLRFVFTNLMTNAIKYRGDRPLRLVFTSARRGAVWQIRCQDQGIGIPEADLERVFELFHRLHRRDEIPGTGLGLSICRRMVETLGGRIWAEKSEQGADIRIEFKARET